MSFSGELHPADAKRAREEPSLDYFDAHPPDQPKATEGEYVVEEGFDAPLITSQAEWEAACDDGTAMLRSELPQDYDGFSGLFSSERLKNSRLQRSRSEFGRELGDLLLRGLRSGELDPTEYMLYLRGKHLNWVAAQKKIEEWLANLDVELFIDADPVSASKWRYIEGANISVFRDPNVEDRYHVGYRPAPTQEHVYPAVGGFRIEPGEHGMPQQFRKHTEPMVAAPFIEFYEQIRTLPLFDTTQCPVIEIQQDPTGKLKFLQYRKVWKTLAPTDPFEIPTTKSSLRTTMVRGVTPPEGKSFRLYLAPHRFTSAMEGQGIYCALLGPRGLDTQLAAKFAGFVLHQAYISFQNNHFDSSPLYDPPLAAGMDGCGTTDTDTLHMLDAILPEAIMLAYQDYENTYYFDINVTSNGREAVIESDWQLERVPYKEAITDN